jgi:phytoene dehydrogenase-like protein
MAVPENVTTGNKIVIIGGGIAGLSCGCYLQMNGYQTEILEANAVPGGLCVAWDRGPYVFDGCLRWLLGTHPSSAFNRIWNELGAINGRPILNHHEFLRVQGTEGQVLSFSSDLDQVARDMKRLSPQDAVLIDKLVAAARRCAALEPPEQPLELMSHVEKTRLLFSYWPMLLTLGTWKGRRFADYVSRYRSPFLREALRVVIGDARMSALVLVMVLAWRAKQNTGYPVGGSRAFGQGIAGRYARLGGTLRSNAQVNSVIVENGRAIGVRCADGTVVPASTVVSCADGRTTIFQMLGGRYITRQIRYAYENYEVFPALLQASLGVDQEFPNAAPDLSLPLPRPLIVDDLTRHHRLEAAFFGSDSGLCPAGKTILIVRFSGHCQYWADLRKRSPDDYTRAKDRLLRDVVTLLDEAFPGVAGKLEFADLATPATFERFTGNWQGSIQGWLPTPGILGRRLPRTLPGLKNFFMAGHWIETGGGLPSVALSGRYVAQMICARDRRKFETSTA